MINPWVLIGAGILWLASLTAVGWWQNAAGHKAERLEWQERESQELQAATAALSALQDKYRGQEQENARRLDEIAKQREKDRTDAANQTARDVAAARSGALRLRLPATTCQDPDRGAPTEAAAGTGERDGAQGPELPREIAADLLSLANDADDVVRQLTACQAVILQDRAGQM